MFKESFFFLLLNANLKDIKNLIYADSLTLTRIIKEMNKVIVKLKVNKAFETNQSFNRMLKMLRKIMTKKSIFIL